jgi:hypothetical protein
VSGTLTTPFRKRVLRHVFEGTPLGFTQFKLAATKRVPSSNASPNQLDEPVGMAYARATLPLGDSYWNLTISGDEANSGLVYWPTATGTWGVLNGWALVTDEATPIVAAVGQMVVPYRVVAGIRPYVPVSGLVVGIYD